MTQDQRTSLTDADIAALTKMAHSPLARPLIVAFALIALNALSGSVGWVAAKIDTKADVAQLSGLVKVLTGEVHANTSQTADLKKSFDAVMSEPHGKVPVLERQQIKMRHEIAVSTGAALAYESRSRQIRKLKAGEDLLGKGYDNLVDDDGITPAAALQTAIKTIALPQD